MHSNKLLVPFLVLSFAAMLFAGNATASIKDLSYSSASVTAVERSPTPIVAIPSDSVSQSFDSVATPVYSGKTVDGGKWSGNGISMDDVNISSAKYEANPNITLVKENPGSLPNPENNMSKINASALNISKGHQVANLTNNTLHKIPDLSLSPLSIKMKAKEKQQFSATYYYIVFSDGGIHSMPLPPQEVSWSSSNETVGIIDGFGNFTALSPGNTTIYADYEGTEASAKVEVVANKHSGGGSSGGSGTGGATSYKTTTTVNFTCANEQATIYVRYLVPASEQAKVSIYFLGDRMEQVFAKTISSATSFQFTPERAGTYELHVILGSDQSTAQFSVPSCVLGQSGSSKPTQPSQSVTVNLEPSTDVVFARTISYQNGFVKKFVVTREEGSSGTVLYTTRITLIYTSASQIANATITDSIPRSAAPSVNQVSFGKTPDSTNSSASDLQFSWALHNIAGNQNTTYTYSFSRPITEEMASSMPSPRIYVGNGEAAPSQSGSDIASIATASIGILGFNFPAIVVAIAGLIVLIGLYYAVFKRKSED